MPNDGTNRTSAGQGSALAPACKLYGRTSAKGTPYLMGRLGGLRVLVMPKRDGEAGEHTHALLIGAAPDNGGGGGDNGRDGGGR